MKRKSYIHRLHLTDFELRVMVNDLNSSRLKMKAEGADPTDVSDIILKSHDPSQRANGFLTLAGSVVITFAKEIPNLITG